MVLVTMFVRSGRVSSFLLVRPIGCTSHHQPDPVGVGFARRMPNKMRKIRMRHRRQDRLRGVTPPSHGGNQKADLNHLGIHTTTARGACCREAVIGGVRLVDFQASPKSISHQPKHNSRGTWFFFDILLRKLFFSGIQCWWSSATRLIMQTLVTIFFPFLDPCRNGISVNVIYLGNGFDRYALTTQQKTMGTHTSSM